jgi:organic hydroperoxide reductase OsmC/OhrA
MLWFLDLAARAGHVVDRYVDRAAGHMGVRADGRHWVARVELSPSVHFVGEPPGAAALADLHHRAHLECYLANSVNTEIVVLATADNPRLRPDDY